jgi:hypothetical protein
MMPPPAAPFRENTMLTIDQARHEYLQLLRRLSPQGRPPWDALVSVVPTFLGIHDDRQAQEIVRLTNPLLREVPHGRP